MKLSSVQKLAALLCLWTRATNAFLLRPVDTTATRPSLITSPSALAMAADDEKFGMDQRIESAKCLGVGLIVGGFALAPFSAIHDLLLLEKTVPMIQSNPLAQFEFDNDMGSLVAGLFAIVYRYCVREDENPQLGQGVVGAFVLTRTLSSIVVPTYCTAITLNCKCVSLK